MLYARCALYIYLASDPGSMYHLHIVFFLLFPVRSRHSCISNILYLLVLYMSYKKSTLVIHIAGFRFGICPCFSWFSPWAHYRYFLWVWSVVHA